MSSNADLTAYVLADIAIILVVLRVGGRVASALSQPFVVGEIVAGILIGPTVLGGHVGTMGADGAGLVDRIFPPEAYSFLSVTSQVGLVLYMFLVGIEVDNRLMRGRTRQIGVVAAATACAPLVLAAVAAPAFHGSTWRPPGVSGTTFALFLGAGLAATALPVMARLLQEKRLMATPVAAMGLGVAGLVTVVVFLVIAAASASAKGSGVRADVGVKLAWTAGLIVLLLAVARPAMGWVLRRLDPERQLGTILTGLLALALATGLAADRIGINALVGGFLFGLSVPATRALADAIVERIGDMVVLFFLPIFFAVSGLLTDFRQLHCGLLPGVVLFLALMIAGKWGPGYVAGRASGLAGPEANALGVLLSCGGLLVLVVGLIGLQLGVITPELQATFVIGAVVTLIMAGPLLDHFMARHSESPEPPPPAIAALDA